MTPRQLEMQDLGKQVINIILKSANDKKLHTSVNATASKSPFNTPKRRLVNSVGRFLGCLRACLSFLEAQSKNAREGGLSPACIFLWFEKKQKNALTTGTMALDCHGAKQVTKAPAPVRPKLLCLGNFFGGGRGANSTPIGHGSRRASTWV